MSQNFTISLVAILLLSSCATQQKVISRYRTPSPKGESYAYRNGQLAVREMIRSGIPASITLAQAMIESAYGTSVLAQKANNHFGIKCHGWRGRKLYLDDGGEGECFRAYDVVEQSYRDHSDFLWYNPRYRSLFSLKRTNYKSWAYGLAAAGYATDPKYPQSLIKIIERDRLYLYDSGMVSLR